MKNTSKHESNYFVKYSSLCLQKSLINYCNYLIVTLIMRDILTLLNFTKILRIFSQNTKKVMFSHTHYQALGPEMIPV